MMLLSEWPRLSCLEDDNVSYSITPETRYFGNSLMTVAVTEVEVIVAV